jgi:hypothetical protein
VKGNTGYFYNELQLLCFLAIGFAHFAQYRMSLSGHADDKAAHLSVTDTGHFGGARHAGVNADIRVGIDIQNVKDVIP